MKNDREILVLLQGMRYVFNLYRISDPGREDLNAGIE